jgi:hypothetical protein
MEEWKALALVFCLLKCSYSSTEDFLGGANVPYFVFLQTNVDTDVQKIRVPNSNLAKCTGQYRLCPVNDKETLA